MPTWNNVKVGSFLTERKDRFKPDEANRLGLKRLYKIDFSGKIHLLDDKQTNTGMILVKKGDLVISGINVEKGAVSIYQGDKDILATIHYSSYNFDKSQIDIDYFKWFLKSQTFKDVMQSQVRGGIKTELKPKQFLPLKIDIPDLPTQETIRDKINNVSNEIKEVKTIHTKNEDYVDKLRQSILQEAVQGKLVPQDKNDDHASILLEKIKAEKEKLIKEKKIRKEKPLPAIKEDEIPFDLPEGWEWVRLGEIVSVLGDGLHGTPQYSENGDYFFINGNNLTNGNIEIKDNTKRVSKEQFEKYKKPLNHRTIFVSINGTIGNVAYYNNENVVLGKSACYFNLLNDIKKDYIKKIIETSYFLNYAIDSATGTTIKNVGLKAMRLFLVPLPPLNEQKRIVEKVDQLMTLCDELQEKVKENKNNADLLMEAVLREAFEVKESGSI